MNYLEIKKSIQNLEKKVNSLEGEYKLLNKQLEDSIIKQKDLQSLQITNQKAIELLHLVKKVTEEKITETFEKVVTSALQIIHQSDEYKFKLEFGRRGSLPEVKFNVLTPEMENYHNILDVTAGGSRDIVALALRFVILELSKMNGFLFLDEPEKRLDNPYTLSQMIKFIKDFQEKTQRQIIIITHSQEFVDAVNNPIIIERNNEIKKIENKTVKNKRGKKKRNGK